MEKSIESIGKTYKELKNKFDVSFLKQIIEFINEETSKPFEEMDNEFLAFCVNGYLVASLEIRLMQARNK